MFLHVEERGAGFPLLLIAGLGTAKWVSSAQWPDYAARRHVLAYDNRGTGLSDKPAGPYSVELMADDAASLLEARGVEQADVYGHSLGGFIALTLALRRPDLVRSLVLVCTGPGGPDHEPLPAATLEMWLSVAGLPPDDAIRRTFPTCFPDGWIGAHPQEYEHWLRARLDPPTPPECWWAQFEAGRRYVDVGVPVERIAVPALVIHGELDAVVPVANGRLLADRLPRSELVLMPACGHMPMLEAPAEFGEAVCGFLDRLDDPSR